MPGREYRIRSAGRGVVDRLAVSSLARKIFLVSLAKVDDIRVDYLSDREKLDGLMNDSIIASKKFHVKLVESFYNNDIDYTDAERVGETGESTDRPA
jgi:hypothetical protein